jgi:hypothetical protein
MAATVIHKRYQPHTGTETGQLLLSSPSILIYIYQHRTLLLLLTVFVLRLSLILLLRGRVISLYSSKIIDKKEMLHTVSNICIYCSSDKVGTIYLLKYIFENSTVSINVLGNSCEDVARCSSECIQTTVQ